jgi:proline dehydrogenase
MGVLGRAVLAVGMRPKVRRMITEGPGRRVARRFVAGETLDDAIRVARRLNDDGFLVTLDALGESVTDPRAVDATSKLYLATLDTIADSYLRSEISVKPTQLGLLIDPERCRRHLEMLVARATEIGTTVTVDMEDRHATEHTIALVCELSQSFPGRVGVALQAYLYRSRDDLRRLLEARVRVRLCKGAYREPRAIALRRREDISASYAALATQLLGSTSYAMLGTHDDHLIALCEREIAARNLAGETYEFQMLHGVRTKLQRELIARGHKVRIYVPFGDQWYPYLLRRLAERPANLRFFAEALVRR